MPTAGERALERVRKAARDTLELMAEDLAARAAADAPVETGRLRGSVSPGGDPQYGGSEGAKISESGDTISVEVSFSTPYAHAQHEGYIDYGAGQEVEVRAHLRHLASGKIVRVSAHTQTRRGRVYFRHHPLGGGKKFLERNLKAMAPRYRAALQAAVAKELAKP